MDYMLNFQEFFHVCYVMLYMPITHFYSPKMFLCKVALSKDFEYVPLQHKSSYRFQDLARDSADLILWALHLKMLQFQDLYALCT